MDLCLLKLKNAPLIKVFGRMYIYFYKYPRYSGRTYAIFEKMLMKLFNVIMVVLILQAKQICTWVNKEIWSMMKTYFPESKQINQCPKSTLCKECTYVQEEEIESEGNIYSPPDNEPTFSSSYFPEKPIVNVETIEERLK